MVIHAMKVDSFLRSSRAIRQTSSAIPRSRFQVALRFLGTLMPSQRRRRVAARQIEAALLRMGKLEACPTSHVEPEVDYVPVLDNVILTLQPELAVLAAR